MIAFIGVIPGIFLYYLLLIITAGTTGWQAKKALLTIK